MAVDPPPFDDEEVAEQVGRLFDDAQLAARVIIAGAQSAAETALADARGDTGNAAAVSTNGHGRDDSEDVPSLRGPAESQALLDVLDEMAEGLRRAQAELLGRIAAITDLDGPGSAQHHAGDDSGTEPPAPEPAAPDVPPQVAPLQVDPLRFDPLRFDPLRAGEPMEAPHSQEQAPAEPAETPMSWPAPSGRPLEIDGLLAEGDPTGEVPPVGTQQDAARPGTARQASRPDWIVNLVWAVGVVVVVLILLAVINL